MHIHACMHMNSDSDRLVQGNQLLVNLTKLITSTGSYFLDEVKRKACMII